MDIDDDMNPSRGLAGKELVDGWVVSHIIDPSETGTESPPVC